MAAEVITENGLLEAGVDAVLLKQSVGRLANEASDLGFHLVDIAGAIQDTATQSSAHAVLLGRLTQSARSIAEANGRVAHSLHESDKLTADVRKVLGEQERAFRLGERD